MSIRQIERAFILETEHTSYIFHILDTGHAEHLYYGRRIHIGEQGQGLEALAEKRAFPQGNTNSYDSAHENLTLENICLEMSSYGKGDIREPFIEVTHGDGGCTCDFLFQEEAVTAEKPEYRTLPGSYGEPGEVEHLCVTLADGGYGLCDEYFYRGMGQGNASDGYHAARRQICERLLHGHHLQSGQFLCDAVPAGDHGGCGRVHGFSSGLQRQPL